MATTSWRAVVALAGSAMLAWSSFVGCGSDDSSGGGGSGTAGATDGGGTAGADASNGGSSGSGGSGATGGSGGSSGNDGGCASGEELCNGVCANTQLDNNNCGACGTVCSGGSACQAGVCTCPTGQTLCGGECVDVQSNPSHCGACNNPCNASEVCTGGTCASSCASGQTDCNGACVDTQTDNNNCGACGTVCGGGSSCQAGTCTCPSGQTLCNGACVTTATDPANCGSCGNACPTGQSCTGGSCGCPSGQTSCSGQCVNTQTDPAHCGNCTTACSSGQVCSNGSCTLNCPSGQTNCSNACVNLQTDEQNCGACGTACPAVQTCTNGACACATGQTLCSGQCVNTQTSNTNCGSCGNACTGGQSCSGGVCGCPSGQTSCSGQCVNTQTSNTNCGSCGTTCPASSTCTGGTCVCSSGLTLCSGACVNTQTSNTNCGACGVACTGGATCQSGTCFKTPVCGDGVVDTGEQCDNGNTSNLDGCDSVCKYEVFTRMNSVIIRGGGAGSATDVLAPAFCVHTANGLGNALSNTALDGNFAVDGLNDSLATDIAAGTTNIIVQALGLDDLNGVNDPSFQLGITTGNPDPARGAWPGSSQIDWWYLLDSTTLDGSGIPTAKLTPAAVANRNLTGGPSTINMLLNLGGSVAQLEMLNAKVAGTTSTATSTPAPPPQPNQLASGLTVFNTIAATGATQGLCGDVTVESLAQIPVPEVLTTGAGACSSTCSQSRAYTYCGQGQPVGPGCNSLLDVLVSGCRASLCILVAAPTQPDVNNGGTAPLTPSGSLGKIPTSQTDNNQNAYSAWFQFSAQRVHATGQY